MPKSPGDRVCRPGHYPGPGECQASPLSPSHICSPEDWRLTLRQMKLVSAFFFFFMVLIIFPENLLTSMLPVRTIKTLLINPCQA